MVFYLAEVHFSFFPAGAHFGKISGMLPA